MNTRKTVRVLLLALAAGVVLLAAAACTNPVLTALTAMSAKSFGLTGTWGNNSYTSGTMYLPQCYRMVINSDGTFASKGYLGGTDSGTYTVVSSSVSGNTRTYTFLIKAFYTYYVLARVTQGVSLEIQSSLSAYPPAFNPSDPMTYGIYYPM